MTSCTGFLVHWGAAWDSGGQRDDARGMLLELFNRVNHDGGGMMLLQMNMMIFQASSNEMMKKKCNGGGGGRKRRSTQQPTEESFPSLALRQDENRFSIGQHSLIAGSASMKWASRF